MTLNRYLRRTVLGRLGLFAMGGAFGSIAIGAPTIEWTESTPAPEPRAGYAAGEIDGRLVLVGGTYWTGDLGDWDAKVFTDVADEFDPHTEVWSRLPEFPATVGYAAGATWQNRLYVLGGVQDGAPSKRVMVLVKTAAGYRWETGPDLPQPRVFAAAMTVGSVIYLIGGTTEFEVLDESGSCCLSATATRTVWALDLAQENARWEDRASFPGHSRWGHRLVSDGRDIYQFGGRYQRSLGDALEKYLEVWRYRPVTDEWALLGELPDELYNARGVYAQEQIMLFARAGQAAVFDLSGATFSPVTALPEDVIIEHFIWTDNLIVGASGESGTERPRRRSELTYIGRIVER